MGDFTLYYYILTYESIFQSVRNRYCHVVLSESVGAFGDGDRKIFLRNSHQDVSRTG